MSVTIALGLVFFYNGWHSENARNAKTLKEMQRKFDETVDFRSLKNLPEWCVVFRTPIRQPTTRWLVLMLTHRTCRLVSPAAEKSDWLNNLLKKLWPKMKEAIAESIRQSLQPTLDYYRPGFLNKLAVRRCSIAAGVRAVAL